GGRGGEVGAELAGEPLDDGLGGGDGGLDPPELPGGLAAAQARQQRGGAGEPVGVGGVAEQLEQQEPLAVRQAVGGHVVGAVVEADAARVEPAQGGQQRPPDVLVVADDLGEDAGGAEVGGVEPGGDGHAL